ncbi:hypothetical protein [Anaerobaca lacustris]|uniref:Uncharacterized protein n=1 Tax=Anaerobaca lacustris TaxID=3044600 RepID=A0AAW6TWM2_9BACT|nr:hypothetical protein [Sedimentisphaerales bacterium M17dextr]
MLDPDQQRECREIAAAIIERVLDRHIEACPHGRNLAILQAKIVGLAAGVGMVGASAVFSLAKLFGL